MPKGKVSTIERSNKEEVGNTESSKGEWTKVQHSVKGGNGSKIERSGNEKEKVNKVESIVKEGEEDLMHNAGGWPQGGGEPTGGWPSNNAPASFAPMMVPEDKPVHEEK